MDIVEWSSVSVLIFVGLATLSTGETRDKLPALRRLTSTCHLRCAGASNRAIFEKECVRSCQRKLTQSIEQSKSRAFSKRMITGKRLFSRHQRSVEDVIVLDECQFSKEGPLYKAKILLVNLTGEGWLHIKWEAIDSSETDFNWTGYGLIYWDKSIDRTNCILVPKNQTDYLVKQVGDWKVPYSFHTAVVVNPCGQDKFELQTFTIGGYPNTYQVPTVPSKDTVTFISSIVGGLMAAVVLLVLYAAVKCRHPKPPSPDHPEIPSQPERYYSCYYPESEEFRKRVASIVNNFRESGYNVIMDGMVCEEIASQGPTRWGEHQIRKAKKVLIFLSPGLVNLAMGGREDSQCQDVSRVWIELEVLRDIYIKSRSAAKMVCIALPEVPVRTALPLWAKVSYKWPGDRRKILKRLNDKTMILPVLEATPI